jgi:hypothetical protein
VTGASQGAMSCQQGQETRSVVERIAAIAVAAGPERLTPEIRRLFKRNILDSLACAIAALPGRPFAALCEQFEEYRAPGRHKFLAQTSPAALRINVRKRSAPKSGRVLLSHAAAKCRRSVAYYCSAAYTGRALLRSADRKTNPAIQDLWQYPAHFG